MLITLSALLVSLWNTQVEQLRFHILCARLTAQLNLYNDIHKANKYTSEL